MTQFTVIQNRNFQVFGIGMRDAGAGDLNVSGVLGTVTNAYLYWLSSEVTTELLPLNANVMFAGNAITGTPIGFGHDLFWNRNYSHAYRADVTAFVTGNGSYALSGFQNFPGPFPDAVIDGAGLIVFYDDPNQLDRRDIYLFDGNLSNYEATGTAISSYTGWDFTVPNAIPYASGAVNMTMFVADGQGPCSLCGDGALRINGELLESGDVFRGESPLAPGASAPLGNLWDVRSYEVSSYFSASSNLPRITLNGTPPLDADALSLVMLAYDVSATSSVPEPSAVLPLGIGLGWLVRRRATSRGGSPSF
jgi:hypothetical protein